MQLQQTLHHDRHWEMGGKGRILVNALTLAAGSNISGSTGQFLQATLQSLGAQQIKQLADSLESETARTALQGLLAATTATAQGQNAATAALGASASVVLNNLLEATIGDRSNTLTLEEREARKNLVTSLIAGTTHALGGDAALANSAATIESENNSFGALAGSNLGLLFAKPAESDTATKAKIAGEIAADNLELASYLGGLPVIVAQDVEQDIAALHKGEKTLQQIALERGEQYIIGTLVGNLAGHGYKAIKHGGKWVAKAVREGAQHGPELATAAAGATQQFSRAAGTINSRTHGVYSAVNHPQPSVNPANKIWSVKGRIKEAQLPTKGKVRFVPKERYKANQPLPKGTSNGYRDKFDNEWIKGPSRTAGQPFEWDVKLSPQDKEQLGWASRDGMHLNVSLDGKITHR